MSTPQTFFDRDRQRAVITIQLGFAAVGLFCLVFVIAVCLSHLNFTVQTVSFVPKSVNSIDLAQTKVEFSAVSLEGTGLIHIKTGENERWVFTSVGQSPYSKVSLKDFQLPPVLDLTHASLQLSGNITLPANTVALVVGSEQNGAGSFFSDGRKLFFMLWIAGDCTPRVFDGLGGYWQMPAPPVFNLEEHAYLIHLPANWQREWYRMPNAVSDWRLCASRSAG